MRWDSKTSPPLKVIHVKTSPYISKDILRNYHYWSDTKLGSGIVAVKRISCSCHDCTTIWSLSWDSKTKEEFNQDGYGKVHNCKYFQSIGCHDNWNIIIILMMEHMKKITNTLIKIFLMVMQWTCTWSFWEGNMVLLMLMIIQVMVTILSIFFISIYCSIIIGYWWLLYFFWWNGTWRNLFLSNQYWFSLLCFTKTKPISKIISLRKIINGNGNVIFYDSKDVLPQYLWWISQNGYNTL